MERLKDEIREKVNRNCIYEDYPCQWRGVVDGKPMVGGLELFGARVLDDLWEAIKAEVFTTLISSKKYFVNPQFLQFPEEDVAADALARARSYHETFIETHARQFVGRSAILKQLHNYVEKDTSQPCVVIGEPGGGKSSLVAAFAREYIRKKAAAAGRREGEPVVHDTICHFVGAAPMSTNIRHTLDRLCKELRVFIGKYDIGDALAAGVGVSASASGKAEEKGDGKKGKGKKDAKDEKEEEAAPPRTGGGEDDEEADEMELGEGMEDYKSLKDNFAKYLERAGMGVSLQEGGKKRLVVIIDALNQLDETYSAHNLDWLPKELPRGMQSKPIINHI